MALTQTEVSELYVAIFNRASEGEGNKYWQTNQPDMATTADVMLNTPDAKEYFGNSLNTNKDFVEWIYKNTLNKTANDDPDGISYWVKELDSGKSKGEVVAALVNAVADYKNSTDATTKAAYDQFMNRVEVSNYTAEHLEKAPTDYKNKLGFNANLTVTNDASTVTSAESIIDDIVQTSNAQVLTPEPDNLHGTSGDDLFDGSVVQNKINGLNVNTFTSEDRIDGGTGNDTLIIQQIGNNGTTATTAAQVSGAVSNVENIKFTAFGATTYDMSNTTGVKDFLNQNSVDNLWVTGANEMNVGIKNINGKSTTIGFDGSVYATTTDSTTLTLENVTNQANVTLTGNTIETVNIVSKTANNKIDLGGTALADTTKLVITGDKDLSIDDTDGTTAMAKITTVDASAFTGNLDLDLRNGGVNKLNITGGSGDDKVIITNFDKDDVIDLGDGKDLLAIDLTADVNTAASLKNIEQMSFRTGADYNVNLDGATQLEEIYMENTQDGGADTLTVKKVSSTIKSVNFVNHDNTDTTNFDNLVLKVADADAVSSLDVNFGSVKSSGNPIPVNMADNQQLTLDELTANGIETLNIKTQNLGKDTVSTDGVDDAGLAITKLADDALTTLNIESDTYVNISANALSDTVKTVDASGTTAGVNLNLSQIADSTATNASTAVTTGTGDDTLTVNIGVSTTIKTDAGNDTITSSGASTAKAKTVIDTGDGNDTIDLTSINATLTDKSSIKVTTGDGMDTIKINANTDLDIGDDNDATNDTATFVITDFKAGLGGDNLVIGTSSSKNDFDLTHTADIASLDTHLATADDDDGDYDIFTDGSDVGIYNDDGDLIVKLAGIDSISSFDADNFAV